MSYLYGGSILFVDLSERKISKEPTSSYTRLFLGGRGIDDKLFYDHIASGVDPLSPQNVIVFGAGPLAGTCLPSSGRLDIMSKSPMTFLWGNSNMGGYFSAELKYAGYDHIVVTGRADAPVYIWIDNGQVHIRDAAEIWGQDTYQTPELIRQELGNPEVKVICIGPAGENLVRFATVQSELGNGAGRTGMGTVMGSKNLKAIAVRGTKGIKMANPEKFLAVAQEQNDFIKNSAACKELSQYGTTLMTKRIMGEGKPFRNFQTFRTMEGHLDPTDILKKYSPKRAGCLECPIRCMEAYDVPGVGSGVISCTFYASVGWIVDNHDPEVFLQSAIYCQKQGLDVSSAGGILAWAMELYQRGIITTQDTDGVSLEWGESVPEMLKRIVHREGFGDVLAEGVLIGAGKIGRGAEDYAVHSKGLPLQFGENPILEKGKTLAMAVNPRGDYLRGYPFIEARFNRLDFAGLEEEELEQAKEINYREYREAERISGTRKGAIPAEYEGKPAIIKYSEDVTAIMDAVGICKWATFRFGILEAYRIEDQARILSLGLGEEMSPDVLWEVAERMRSLERAFAVREGLTPSDDRLPARFFELETPTGLTLSADKFEEMKRQYYVLRGWDGDTGIPTRESLERLGIGDVADDLEKQA